MKTKGSIDILTLHPEHVEKSNSPGRPPTCAKAVGKANCPRKTIEPKNLIMLNAYIPLLIQEKNDVDSLHCFCQGAHLLIVLPTGVVARRPPSSFRRRMISVDVTGFGPAPPLCVMRAMFETFKWHISNPQRHNKQPVDHEVDPEGYASLVRDVVWR